MWHYYVFPFSPAFFKNVRTHRPAGIIRSHDGLTYLRVFESGHMVRWMGARVRLSVWTFLDL